MSEFATNDDIIEYINYKNEETMLPDIHRLVSKDLSEPYSVFTYRYFLEGWPKLCICAYAKDRNTLERKEMIATIVCKAEKDGDVMQGYLAMLAVDTRYRKRGIASTLITKGIERMIKMGCTEIMLETEESNVGATNLYTKIGFIKEEKMSKYYLNGENAFRLKLWIDKEIVLGEDDCVDI